MAGVKVQGETYQSSDELLDSIAELERARDNSPEYGPQRPRIEAHLNALRRALRTLKETEAAASAKTSARASRDVSRKQKETAVARQASSKQRRTQVRDFSRGSRRDVSRFSSATGIDKPVGTAGDMALQVVSWTIMTVLFFVLIKPGGKGPKTVAAVSGGAQSFLDRLLDPSKPLVSYASKPPSTIAPASVGPATTPKDSMGQGSAGFSVLGSSMHLTSELAGATKFIGSAKTKIIGTPDAGTHGVAFNKAGGSDNWESENAFDLAVPVGTPVYAEAAGKIGSQIGSLGTGGRFAGIRLHLVTAGNEFYYAHLSKLAPGIKAGTTVKAGQLLGYSGSANGVAHLHIASKVGSPLG
jgi:hypothetical protein